MTPKNDKLADEAGRIKAFQDLDLQTCTSESSFDQITSLLGLSLRMEMVALSLISADRQILKARHGFDLGDGPRHAGFCEIAIRDYAPLVVEDTHRDARFRDKPFVPGGPVPRSYIGAPLTTQEGYNLGTICAFDTRPRLFSDRARRIVRDCARIVMTQLELRRQASRDFLTGVFNRRSFMSALDLELARLRRSKGCSVVALLDIDRFKKVNDTFGHLAGDRVLREFAAAVSGECRAADLFARLGGEEFAVMLHDTDLDTARVWADRVRGKVADARFNGELALEITVSIGLAPIGETRATADAVTGVADSALFDAKRQGRNRVVA
ncbi:sensor domain-containing diguanylate cyclase [Roseovarius sp. D22-M7]|uniref:sensor domain-containing diguanylate cyclase n=1 Tax=Roseovarius sp. D22-M7 TaxID=3127116 RepID=UPI0030101AC9